MMKKATPPTPGTIAVLLLAAALAAASAAFAQETLPADSQPAATAPALPDMPATQPFATAPADEMASTEPATTEPVAATMAATMPATQPVDPAAPIAMNFRDATLRSVLEYLSEAAGLVIVEDARVDGRVTVVSRQNLTVDEATALLDTVLKEKGFAAVRDGRVLKIVTLEQAKKECIPVRAGNNPEAIAPSDRIITQIIPIRYADAIKLKTDLASLIPTTADVTSNASSNTLIVTGTESTIRRIVEIIQAIDVHMSEVSQVKVFQLRYANASSAARLITDVFRDDQAMQNAQQNNARRAFFTRLPGMPGGGGGGNNAEETGQRNVRVTASADDRTNTLVVSAAPDVLKVIEGVVKDLDANPAEDQAVFIYRLKNAQAVNLESVLNNIFGFTGGSSYGNTNNRQGGNSNNGSNFGRNGNSNGNRGLGSGMNTPGGNRAGGSTQSRVAGRSNNRSGAAAANSDLAGQVYVVADPDTNSLVVTTASKNFERVKSVITDLDKAVPQVLIKVLIAEVTHDNSLDLGVEFSGMNLRGSQVVRGLSVGRQIPIDPTTGVPMAVEGRGGSSGSNFGVAAQNDGFTFRLDEKYVSAAVRAIANVAKLDVLSRPYILTSDNQQASILVGQEVPFVTNTRTTDTGQTINTIEYDDIGIILNVTPHINPQGLVTMDVYPEISTLTGERVPISDTLDAPVFAKRSAQSRVAVRDGQTIVIGGLMEDRSTKAIEKVPVLGDIPCLGLLFKRTVDRKTKTELLIFLTPHVALQPEELQEMGRAEKDNAKVIQQAVEGGALGEHLKGMDVGAIKHEEVQATEPEPVRFGADTEPAAEDADEPKK